RLNGSGDLAIQNLAALLRGAGAAPSAPPDAATSPHTRHEPTSRDPTTREATSRERSERPPDQPISPSRDHFPVELVLDTAPRRALVATSSRLLPPPDLLTRITRILGPQSAHIVGGIAVEMTNGNGRDYASGRPNFARRSS